MDKHEEELIPLHKDDYILILGDIAGIIILIIGLFLHVDPIYMFLLIYSKWAEVYLRYRRYQPPLNKPFSLRMIEFKGASVW